MITGAIFDVDGTLLDSMTVWDHAGEWYLKRMGIAARDGLGKILFPMTMEAGARYLKKEYQLPGTIPEILDGINHTVEDFYAREVLLKPGVKRFLMNLKEIGIPMCSATSSDRRVVAPALERLGVLDYFMELFTCSECGAGKERPDIYERASRTMRSDKNATWVFEDAVHAARTARAAGFRTVGVYDESSRTEQARLKENCDFYLRDFSDEGFAAFYQAALGQCNSSDG